MALWISNFSVYETSYDVENNTSQVRYLLQATSDGSWNYDSTYGWARIDWGIIAEYSNSFSSGETVTLCDKTVVVPHNADGRKKIYADYAWNTGLQSAGTLSGGTNIALTTIPRGSKLGKIAAFDIEDVITIPITKYASSFIDNLTVKIGSTTIKTVNNITNGASISFNVEELSAVYDLMSSVNSTAFTFTLETYSGSTLIGTNTQNVTGSITDANPTFTDFDISEGIAKIATLTNNKYIRNHSTVALSIPQATAKKGAYIISYNINGIVYSPPVSYPLMVNLSNYSNDSISIYAIDSRGNSALVTKQLVMSEYTDLIATSQSASRSQNGIGSEVSISINGSWWNGNFYQTENSLSASYRYKKTSDSKWTAGTTSLVVNTSIEGKFRLSSAPIAGDLGANGFDVNYAYIIEVNVSDILNNISGVNSLVAFQIFIGAGVPAIKIKGNKITHLNLSEDVIVGTIVDFFYPVGSIYQSFKATSPASLFGGTWTQIKDRFLYAANSSGVKGGERKHTLNFSEIPAQWLWSASRYDYNPGIQTTVSHGGAYGINTQFSDNDVGKAHNNMPPYITCYMWRRTA